MASRFTITLTIHHVYKAALNKQPEAVLLVTTCFSHLPAREAQHPAVLMLYVILSYLAASKSQTRQLH